MRLNLNSILRKGGCQSLIELMLFADDYLVDVPRPLLVVLPSDRDDEDA